MARAAFKPTPTQRRKVASAKAGGMADETIALALGITRPTLLKYFETELTTGAATRKMEALDALFLAARKGNVSAIKTVILLREAIEPTQPAQPAPGKSVDAPAPAARLGKKEAQQLAAVGAADGTDWEGLLPSTRVVQ